MIFTKFSLKLGILSLVIISFFVGFIFRDLAPGGAAGDFEAITWPLLQSFKYDFYYSITNYGRFGEGSYPLFYIINAYLNPFSFNKLYFILSVTFVSFITFILFAILLKRNFPHINYIDSLLACSIILLLPFFRSSAYGGTTENFGWFFFILSLYFLNKIKDRLENFQELEFFTLFSFCFFSSCALYIRPALVFLPIAYFLYLFLVFKNKKIIINSIILYFIFAIPGFILIYIWGGLYDTKNFGIGLTSEYYNYKFILGNIPILLSYFAFYFFPILFVECLDVGLRKFFHKYVKSFLFCFIIFILLSQIGILDYLGKYIRGGGAILKLNYIFKPENYILLIIFSSIGYAILQQIIKENYKVNIIILLTIFIINGLSNEIYQEYSEPLILFIFFFGIVKTQLHSIYFRKAFVSNLVLFLYFTVYLIGATYYKHFM